VRHLLRLDVAIVFAMDIDELKPYLPIHGHRLFALETTKLLHKQGGASALSAVQSETVLNLNAASSQEVKYSQNKMSNQKYPKACENLEQFLGWQRTRPWLKMSPSGSVMCESCQEIKRLGVHNGQGQHNKSAFVDGTVSDSTSTKQLLKKIDKHKDSLAHCKFVEILAADRITETMRNAQVMFEERQTDSIVLQLWNKEVSRENGHYILPIPVKDTSKLYASGRCAAEKRLMMLKNRFMKDDNLKVKYTEAIQAMLDAGYAEQVPENELNSAAAVHYLPHHPVINPNKAKIRVVFDCAAKAEDGLSLYDQVFSGPGMTNKLVGVLLCFRKEAVAVVADISSMFNQVHVAADQRDLLRFLWWPDGDTTKNVVTYRMKVHLFGGTWSPRCAAYALRRLADDYVSEASDMTRSAVKRNFYVDDLMKSTKCEQEAIQFAREVDKLLRKGGFSLCKWLSNSRTVLESIPADLRADAVKDLSDKMSLLPLQRTLSLHWDVQQDAFYFQAQPEDKPCRRRGILNVTSSIFDPC
jgi:hypothetical protein